MQNSQLRRKRGTEKTDKEEVFHGERRRRPGDENENVQFVLIQVLHLLLLRLLTPLKYHKVHLIQRKKTKLYPD